jgi:hypothetical protein
LSFDGGLAPGFRIPAGPPGKRNTARRLEDRDVVLARDVQYPKFARDFLVPSRAMPVHVRS